MYLIFAICYFRRILHVLADASLKPPDMENQLDHTATFAKLSVVIMRGFLGASTWNASTMTFSENDTMVEYADGSRVTLLVPLDDVLEATFTVLELRRFTSPVWSRHLHDMLAHMILPRVYTQQDIRKEAEEGVGFGQVQTVGGDFLPVELSSNSLTIGGANIVDPSIGAVDG